MLNDIGLVIIAAAVIAAFASKFRQPLLLGYVLAGILIGPLLGLVSNPEPIKILSELGIAFLLFIIGLELDLKRIKDVGLVSSVIGLIQVAVTTAAGYFIAIILGFKSLEAAYIGLVISFSSTMIVAKLLGEKKELESLHGELVLGVLIIQDIIAVIVLSLIGIAGHISLQTASPVLVKGFLLIAASYAIYKYLLPFFLEEAVHSTELIFISALTTMFVFSAVAMYFGYSFSIGAFIAGVALSTTRYNHEITGRVKPLKDFFLVLFFVTLGMQMVFRNVQSILLPLAALLIAVLLLKPLLIFLIVKAFKYSNRTAFFTGAQLAQVGEFSLVLAAQGILLAHITQSLFSMLIALTIITMVLTAYIIKFDDDLYNQLFSQILKPFGKESVKENYNIKKEMKGHTVIFGLHKMSERIIDGLKKSGKKFIVVDHNPEKARMLAARNISCICSDMTNPEVYEHLNLPNAKTVISAVHNLAANTALIRQVKRENRKATVMVACNSEDEAIRLYEAGADFVIIPLILGGQKAIDYLAHLKPKEISMWGKRYYEELKHGAKK